MDYNGLYTSLLLMRLSNGEYIPLPSVQASYGPFNSLEEAMRDLVNTFKAISNVPRGYTFCVIENNKPQEYWFTKTGDWASVEKKNTSSSSSSSTVVSGLIIKAIDDYLQVSYDNGVTWTKLVALEDLRGPQGNTGSPGRDGKDGTSDLSKVQIRMTSRVVSVPDPEDEEQTTSYTEYKIDYTTNGGVNWITVGTIRSGSGGGGDGDVNITIETYIDGNQYWKKNGVWMEDDQGHMVRANGKDGADGADGEGYYTQFKSIIFKRSNNTRIVNGVEMLQESEYPQGGTYSSPVPPTGGWYDGVPIGTAKLWMSTRWFSTNEALTDANEWSVPAPATDTADIDFEYSNAPLDEIPNGPGISKNINIYNATTNPNGWYDADETVLYNGNELLQNANWMTMRVCKNGVWGSWKTFKIRGESGESPLVPTVEFTSIVFRRSNNTRIVNGKEKLAANEYPQGGEYSSPVPTNRDSQNRLLWSDGLPVGSGELLWMSKRIFRSDNNHGEWEEPIRATDGVDGWDFEWCDAETPRYAYPTRTSPDDNAPGRAADDTRAEGGWYDEAAIDSDPIWMAMRPYEGNVYTSPRWTVMRVKGERGTDGTSFVAKGQLFGIFDTPDQAKSYYQQHASTIKEKYVIVGTGLTSLYEFSSTYPNGRLITPISAGDAYVNSGGAGKNNGTAGDLKEHVFIWDGDNFVDFGNIQGPKGDNVYFHIKFSNDGGHSFTFSGDVQDGETPGDYIGLRVDTVAADSMNPGDYLWSAWKGEDGFGYEYIFKLTADDHAPAVPTLSECHDYTAGAGTQDARNVTYQDDDYVPGFLGWTDDPGSPTKDLPYCWVAYRRKINGQWQAYRGGSADSRYAALFSVYTSNGRGIDHMEEKYALGTSGTTAPSLNEFGNNIPEFDFEHGLIYLWNYEVIYYDDDTTQTTDPECIAVSERGVGIASIQEFYYACDYGDTDQSKPEFSNRIPTWGSVENGRSSAWKTKPMNVDKNNPFLWNFELITFTDGRQTWTDPTIIAYYVYTDVEYLMTIFKKVEGNSDTAYLGGIVGVVERGSGNNDVLRAMLNATNHGASSTHGKLIIASGFNGYNDVANASFKVYEDGHVEMLDSDVRGFYYQYFRRYHDVAGTNLGTNVIAKNANAICLGWTGLSYTDANGEAVTIPVSNIYNYYYVDLSVYGNFPSGRVILTNSYYMDSAGNMHYNKDGAITALEGHFVMPDGNLISGVGGGCIFLRNGWIELIKVDCLNSQNQLIPNAMLPTRYGEFFIVLGFGGDVYTRTSAAWGDFSVDSAGIINGHEISDMHRRDIEADPSTEHFIQLGLNHKYLMLSTNASTSDSDFYVVLPKMQNEASATLTEYYILLPGAHGRILFKTAELGTKVTQAMLTSLTDARFWNATQPGGILTIPMKTARSEGPHLIKITRVNFDLEYWVVETIADPTF